MSTSPGLTSQLARFGAVGVTTLVLDFVTYRLLLLAGMHIPPSKAAGFIVGTTAAYLLNRIFTFNHGGGRRTVVAFLVLYGVTLLLNVGANEVGLWALDGVTGRITWAFLIAQAITSAANFVGMRYYVFRHSPAD